MSHSIIKVMTLQPYDQAIPRECGSQNYAASRYKLSATKANLIFQVNDSALRFKKLCLLLT